MAEYHIAPDTIQSPIRQVPIYETRGRGYFNGGGGIDVIRRNGPGTFAPRPENYISAERIDLENGVFDTVVMNAEMIRSTEIGELEIVADWFDQIILDPMLTWNRSVDAAFSSQVFRPDSVDFAATVRTPLETFVIGRPTLSMQTQESPLGRFSMEASGDPDVNQAEGQSPSITLSWLTVASSRQT